MAEGGREQTWSACPPCPSRAGPMCPLPRTLIDALLHVRLTEPPGPVNAPQALESMAGAQCCAHTKQHDAGPSCRRVRWCDRRVGLKRPGPGLPDAFDGHGDGGLEGDLRGGLTSMRVTSGVLAAVNQTPGGSLVNILARLLSRSPSTTKLPSPTAWSVRCSVRATSK